MKNLLLKLSAFIYPVTCSCCGKDIPVLSKRRICAPCKNDLKLIEGLICQKCGLPLYDGGEHCYTCRKRPKEFYFDKMRSAYAYKGYIRKLVLKFKYSDRMFLAGELAEGMIAAMRNHVFFNEVDIIVPVPLSIVRRIKRGYNQAELLANGISEKISKPVVKNALVRKKITKPQFKLSKQERFDNIKDSFAVKNKDLIKNKNILLVDDIATTSATASACAKALKEAGGKKVYVITLARD